MLFQDSALMDRIFKVFDTDDDNMIDFNEYISCLSTVSNKATAEDKLKCKQEQEVEYSVWKFALLRMPRRGVAPLHKRSSTHTYYS